MCAYNIYMNNTQTITTYSGKEAAKVLAKHTGKVYTEMMGGDDIVQVQIVKSDLLAEISFQAEYCDWKIHEQNGSLVVWLA